MSLSFLNVFSSIYGEFMAQNIQQCIQQCITQLFIHNCQPTFSSIPVWHRGMFPDLNFSPNILPPTSRGRQKDVKFPSGPGGLDILLNTKWLCVTYVYVECDHTEIQFVYMQAPVTGYTTSINTVPAKISFTK